MDAIAQVLCGGEQKERQIQTDLVRVCAVFERQHPKATRVKKEL